MRVEKSGMSLAVRLSADAAKTLDIKRGNEVEITITKKCDSQLVCEQSRKEALASLRRLSRPFPPGFKFNREEANER